MCVFPRIHFDIMNTVNPSSRFSGFQLKLRCSPRVIPPPVPADLPKDLKGTPEAAVAMAVVSQVVTDVAEAKDNLLATKVVQAHSANVSRGKEIVYKVGDFVRLSTFNRRRDYKCKGEKCVVKFMPRWNGPYEVEKTHPETSNYTLVLPNSLQTFATFHVLHLKPHCADDDELFPGRAHIPPGPVMTVDGLEEYFIDEIMDMRRTAGCPEEKLLIVKLLMFGLSLIRPLYEDGDFFGYGGV